MFNVHVLKLRSHLQAERFEQFARDKWLPALVTESTRLGDLASAQLLRRSRRAADEPEMAENEFLLIVDWNGIAIDLPRTNDTTVDAQFSAFGIELVRIGAFAAVGERRDDVDASTQTASGSGSSSSTTSESREETTIEGTFSSNGREF